MGVKKYKIVTFGCQMNLADSGALAAVLNAGGYLPAETEEDADLIVLNTCSVREKAEERVFGRLGEMSRYGDRKQIAVVGCMAQRLGEKITERAPNVDYVLGTDRMFDLPALLDDRPAVAKVNTQFGHEAIGEFIPIRDDEYSAFVTISRGCDNYCSYCIVPYVRGSERSYPQNKIINQINEFVSDGVLEVTLLGQNVNSYADNGCDFASLLKSVAGKTAVRRIRFMTSHPKDLSDNLIEAMASEDKVMPHLHLPLQSGSDRVLERMGRIYDYGHYRDLVGKLRQAVPDIALTTDLIVGFPGETAEDFEATLEAVREISYDSAFMFRYSIREGTEASQFEDDVPEDEKIRRLKKLIEIQKNISFEKNQGEVGTVREVLIDGFSRRSKDFLKGKTEHNKTILFKGDPQIIGSICRVKVNSADSWTLHGELIG